ncbi:hypothetical protein [Pseudomonas japonica]|uniref:DUF4234 domain-containing protein n=1 Tax=Pseudomonas japonica TaxID=256466 RepID=A0A239ATN0_9PSED|nr:hypothetical protein [Pseudomonas japonica]SNR98682.1 hypothetical protein SAMN05444352_10267 [Pseudomonas japonica]
MSTCSIAPDIDHDNPRQPMFFVVSINKLITMSLLTTGVYLFYWFYRNWAIYRAATGERVIPLLRAIIPVLFIYPLLKRIDQGFRQSGREFAWSPLNLALTMWMIVIISLASGAMTPEPIGQLQHDAPLHLRYLIESMLQLGATLWLVCCIQHVINAHEQDPQGRSNSEFTGANKGWMTLGVVIWVLYFSSVATLLLLAYL